MASRRLAGIAPLQRIFGAGTLTGLGEGQLLDRFVSQGDEAAFEAIVARHGPMVLGVCRRQLRDSNDVEDAFQATFLVLVKKARSLRDGNGLGPWLHGVAHRVASRARVMAERKLARLRTLAPPEADPSTTEVHGDALAALDEEVARLPEVFRKPIVLCHIEGRSYEEAARTLHWSEGQVRGRLARGRERLRHRLVSRGFAPVAEERPADLSPTLPAALQVSTLKLVAARSISGAVPAGVTALAEGVSRSMNLLNRKLVAAGLLALGIIVPGALVLSAQDPQEPAARSESKAVEKPDLKVVREALDEWWKSLETLSFREEERDLRTPGRLTVKKLTGNFLPGGPDTIRLEFAMAPGGRFAYDLRDLRADGSRTLILKKRWDGQKYYHFYPEDNNSESIRFIEALEVEEPRDRYTGEMSNVLWLILPTGEKLGHGAFSGGTHLEIKDSARGGHTVFLVDDRNPGDRAELDPEHGWMPRKVWLGRANHYENQYSVTRFTLEAGHWFPMEGTHVHFSADQGATTKHFVVTNLQINKPIDDSEFNLADFPTIPVDKADR